MAGIGKTTLASAVFQRLSYFQFESCCFLWNVREEYLRHGRNYMRKKLLSDLLRDESILSMDTPFVGSSFIHGKLCRLKVLIVLDDVDSSKQLDDIVGPYDRFASGSKIDHFAPGSIIIVTTKNKQVLIEKEANDIYKLAGLNHKESLELFNLHAFGKSSPSKDYEMLVNHATRYADGHPLALKVLGSFLHSKSTDEWESALNKLKIIPNKDILDVLRISYEGLDKGEQNLFLDIACLINQSFTREDAEKMLDAGDSFVKIGLTVLIEKSLIESCENNELWMHDLLRQVGQTIVHDEHREPGKRSRVWDVNDVCHVLERNTGTAGVEGISFNMSKISIDIKVCRAAFSEIYNLRILKIYCEKKFKLYLPQGLGSRLSDNIHNKKFKLYLPQGFGSYLSDKLSYLQWDLYPLKSLPSKFSPENLVELILHGSHVQKLWNHHEVKSLPMLRRIDLSYSQLLTELPDPHSPNLESLNLEGCKSLVHVLSSRPNLEKLTYLNLNGCSKLRDLDDISKSTQGYLDVARLGGIKNLWKNFTYLKSCIQSFTGNLCLYSSQGHISQKFAPDLRCLLLCHTAIETVPPSIGDLSGLVQLKLSFCRKFKSLPSSICHLKSLESLNLCGCEKLKTFPEILEPMKRLRFLQLSYSGIKELPESIVNLVSLINLDTSGCKDLEFLPNGLCNLRNLKAIKLGFCSKLQKLPSLPPSLHVLNTHNTMIADRVVIQILASIKFGSDTLYHNFCYPGDEIPKWFNHQTCGTSINNIMLPPYWNNDDFLALAFCIVFHWNKIDKNRMLITSCTLKFKTIDDGSLYKYHNCTLSSMFNQFSSNHVLIWYVKRQSSESGQEMDGLDWPTTCSTEASFHVCLAYYEQIGRFVSKLSNLGSKYGEIKKFGVWFVYKQDMERCDAETERKNKRSFNECCESSGSEAVGSLEEEDDDESHSKKPKRI
ncbi:disease resistance protein RUN1-like [Ziziphus jujuba]|uniref:ADP-ribosyl cyclase/cyclic ADP-ribose hydrolase n=1 Tax=Ziziphus jujuba TaxID=326968 RepID=A0ABM4AB12_ZIZJJ|nr:disease resistance protein RUN1-like [Ziziphus jujuba]